MTTTKYPDLRSAAEAFGIATDSPLFDRAHRSLLDLTTATGQTPTVHINGSESRIVFKVAEPVDGRHNLVYATKTYLASYIDLPGFRPEPHDGRLNDPLFHLRQIEVSS